MNFWITILRKALPPIISETSLCSILAHIVQWPVLGECYEGVAVEVDDVLLKLISTFMFMFTLILMSLNILLLVVTEERSPE